MQLTFSCNIFSNILINTVEYTWFDNVYFRDWANTDITQEIQEFQKDI